MDKWRMTGREINAMLHLQATWCAIDKAKDLTDRMKRIKVYKYYKIADAMITKVMDAVRDSMLDHQRESHTRHCRTLEYGCFVKRPSNINPDDGLWLSYPATNEIMHAALDHCMLCNKNPQEMRSCPLHKAFDELPVARADGNNPNCPYFGGL